MKPVDMNAVFTGAASQFSSGNTASKAAITSEKLPVVMGHANLLMTLLTELFDNVCKFQKPDASAVIHVRAHDIVGAFEFSVEDHGIGIPEEHSGSLFQIFHRLHGHKYPGLGLGLAIAKRIVEMHHGRIWIDAAVVNGATVRFTMPGAPA